jgi:transmembrane sensor
MDTKNPVNYQVEDFVTDESFANYHFCLNTADQLFWENWMRKHPDKTTIIEEAKNMLNMLSLTLHSDEYKEELKQIRDAITIESISEKKSGISIFRLLQWDKPRTGRRIKIRIAAAILLPLLLVLIVGGYFFTQRLPVNANPLSLKYNSENKPKVFTLEDGTVVTLASNSSLKYPVQFKEKERKIYLQGEAQFQVAKDPDHPFKVYQDNIIATVLGTTFNVIKQEGDSVISVELLTGKLQVEAISSSGSLPKSIILEPNQKAVYDFHNQSLVKEAWKQNKEEDLVNNHLVLKQSSFEEIAIRFKALYGVTVVNQSNKKNWQVTGEFNNTTAKMIMENICLVKNLNLEIRGDTFFINDAAGIK